jgi:hypothetical protein
MGNHNCMRCEGQMYPIVYRIMYYQQDRAAVIAYNQLGIGYIPYTQDGAYLNRRRKYPYEFSWCEKCFQTLRDLPSCVHVNRIDMDYSCC